MASSDILHEIKDIKINIKMLNAKLDDLTWNYVRASVKSVEYINQVFNLLHRYLTKKHNVSESDSSEILQTIREGITMGPISHNISKISKYDTRVRYDSILYEWNGKRYMYVRADENCDNYYTGCDYYNGSNIEELEVDSYEKFNWWKTDESIEKNIAWYNALYSLERFIKKSIYPNNILDDLKSLPPELRLFRIIFDMCCGCHCLIKNEENIKSAYECIPCVSYDD